MERKTVKIEFGEITVHLLPVLTDNYTFIIQKTANNQAIVVDPGEFNILNSYLLSENLQLIEIWITHHHRDHVDGVQTLKEQYNCIVRGTIKIPGRIKEITDPIEKLPPDWKIESYLIKVLSLPGHTHDHIGYWMYDGKHSLIFSGDVLFGFGCGRLFEGSYEEMFHSLKQISELPPNTRVFCAHEYTGRNLEFTLAQNSMSSDIHLRKLAVEKLIESGVATIPLLLSEELNTNLFLKAVVVIKSVDKFTRLRKLRDKF